MTICGRPLLLLTRDAALANRLTTVAGPERSLRVAADPADLQRGLEQTGPAVVLVDVRAFAGNDGLAQFMASAAAHVVIGLGIPRSASLLQAGALGVYAVEDIEADVERLRALLEMACGYLDVMEENRFLRRQRKRTEALLPAVTEVDTRDSPVSIRELSRILRSLNDLESMLDRLVEEVAGSLHFARVGLVIREMPGEDYSLRAGWMLIDDSRTLRFSAVDQFVRWFERHAHLVDRAMLDRMQDPVAYGMLRGVLDRLGAEAMVPLRARSGLLGWLFVGHHLTGNPLNQHRLEELAAVGDMIAASLESALLYREVTVQKKMAESLLHAQPDGIVFADPDGRIRWFSTAAAAILDQSAADVCGQPVERLGGRLADLMRRTLAGETFAGAIAWTDPATRRPLQVSATCLMESGNRLGVLSIITDMSARKALKEQQDRLERTAFWNDLSAGMSHEIRNPLVAIKTFAQLLPERYNDPEFRDDFSRMVDIEVNRLNGIIEQINRFAHPAELHCHPLDIRGPLLKALETVLAQIGESGAVRIERSISDALPRVEADEATMRDCFGYLLTNAVEALAGRSAATLRISAESITDGTSGAAVKIQIADNGPGMPPAIRDNVFSPFCTTKAHGMGLGLSLAQRAVVDHNGRLEIFSSAQGTIVTIILPAIRSGEAPL